MAREALFDRGVRVSDGIVRSSSTAVVHVPTVEVCPSCNAPVEEVAVTMQALFVHGGYGAARRTVRRWCGALCGWSITPEVAEERPQTRGEP
jgi:hypothetical protein